MNFDDLVQIELKDPGDFLKVKETLTRIGIGAVDPETGKQTLSQTCHIFHKQGKYAIVHFKELFLFDGKQADFTQDDLARRNTIVFLLAEWGLLKIKKPELVESPRAGMHLIRVIPFKEKEDWTLRAQYTIGKKF